jgi:hypothetical protein
VARAVPTSESLSVRPVKDRFSDLCCLLTLF